MNQYKQIFCPQCESKDLVKNGHSENGTQRYRCKSCSKSFQTDYSYNAWKPGVKDQIDEQTLNSSGVRDIVKRSGIIIAWQNGRRTDEVLKKLLAKVAHLPIFICHTDEWRAYQRLFPQEYLHLIGKDNTWKIERKNLNFRTHLKRLSRRTICFSKNETIHDNAQCIFRSPSALKFI